MNLLMIISSICGAIITILSLFGIVLKFPSKWLKKIAVENIEEIVDKKEQKIIEAEEKRFHNIEEKLEEIRSCVFNLSENLEIDKEATRAALRHSITDIYEKYFSEKILPTNVKKDLCSLYEAYEKLSGNSYVHEIFEEMMKWDVK